MIKIFLSAVLFFSNLFAGTACEQFQEEIRNKITCTTSFMNLAQQAINAIDDTQREGLDTNLQALFSSMSTSDNIAVQLYPIKTLEEAQKALEAYTKSHQNLLKLDLNIEGYKNYTD